MSALTDGLNVVIQQKVGNTNTPIYPFTHAANVILAGADGYDVDTVIGQILAKNFVPDYSEETASSLRFLRNDNTWVTIQSASTSQVGVVQLSNALDSTSETTAATSKAAKGLKDAIDTLNGSVSTSGSVLKMIHDNAKNALYEAGTGGDPDVTIGGAIAAVQSASAVSVVKQQTAETGYAATYYVTQAGTQVGEKINIPKDYLVKSGTVQTCTVADQPVTGYKVGDKYLDFVVNTVDASATDQHIYILVKDLVDVYTGTTVTNGISVSVGNDNAISASVSGKAIARANITDAFENDIAAVEGAITTLTGDVSTSGSVLKMIHDNAASAVYQAGTGGAADITISDALDSALAILDNLDASITNSAGTDGISSSLTEVDGVVTALSVSQQAATSSENGYMTSTYAAKLDNCMQIAIDDTAPSFTNGLWFEVVSEDGE